MKEHEAGVQMFLEFKIIFIKIRINENGTEGQVFVQFQYVTRVSFFAVFKIRGK